jgi:DNA-binding NtrC family response regulator
MDSPALILSQQGREAFRVPLPARGTLTIGRGPECGVSLPDPDRLLSRLHCELRVRPGGVFVVDHSSNGTRLGGARLARGEARLLRSGVVLELAGWELTVRSGPAPRDPESTVDRRAGPRRPAADPGGTYRGMRADAPAMRDLFAQIERIAAFEAPVLIHGETGVGKELVAQAVHDASRRKDGPFVAVNCGAIHGETAHSRLFGHDKGAFTGAASASKGAFREADGGTLFLDELGELSLRHQTTLLRVLERREVMPLGASRPVPVDYRLVAATHRDLTREVSSGRFREDLYYRLDVAVLQVPPLRDRRDDVLVLARHFLAQLAPGPPPELSPRAVEALVTHPWPGNVRELRNAILRALLTTDGGAIEPGDLALRAAVVAPRGGWLAKPAAPTWEVGGAEREPTERVRILRALQRCDGNRKEAAQLLGMARSTLYARMRRLGLG